MKTPRERKLEDEVSELRDWRSALADELTKNGYSDEDLATIYDEYVGVEPLSDCCGATIIYTDICSDCKEHCGVQEWEDDELTPEQMNDDLRSIGF